MTRLIEVVRRLLFKLVDFVIERVFDASKGYFDKHCVKQSLFFGIVRAGIFLRRMIYIYILM